MMIMMIMRMSDLASDISSHFPDWQVITICGGFNCHDDDDDDVYHGVGC